MKDMKEGIIMKEIYERPRIMVEEFAVNRAIANCDEDMKLTFNCMIGDQTDTTNVITDNCLRKAATTLDTTGYTTISTVGSNGNSFSRSDNYWYSDDHKTLYYTAPTGAKGLIYFCTYSNGTSCFTVNNSTKTIEHNQTHPGQYHVEVLPTYGDIDVGS